MSFTLNIHGQLNDRTEPPSSPDGLIKITSSQKILLGASRGGDERLSIEVADARDAVCLHMADGLELWMSAKEFTERYRSETSRGAPVQGESYEIGLEQFRRSDERGVFGWAVKALEFVGFDLTGESAEAIAGWFEKKQLDGRDGVYVVDLNQISAEASLGGKQEQAIAADDKPLLVFLHGTASSFCGSYGKLWEDGNDEAARARAAARKALADRYSNRVYALEHRSMTQSPIDNALALVDKLPMNAKLHLVSHSRGGLVGELLCLCDQRGKALTDEVLDKLFSEDRTLADLMGFGKRTQAMEGSYAEQRRRLAELLKTLDDKNIRIERFVRAACPAMGTTLASGKLDRWLSVLKFVGGKSLLGDLRDFILAVVKKRTDPRSLPGLEAMMPGSAVVRMLNMESLQVEADLSVIAGDCDGNSLWARTKLALVDMFYAGDHDLVVNTGSMYGGARRGKDGARRYFTRGEQVCHFNYFLNTDTVEKLRSGLLREEGSLGGFDPLQESDRKAPARAAPRQFTGPHPVAFMLPGVMGSSLAARGEEVWLDKGAVFRGELMELAIERDGVSAVAPLEKYYGDFIEFLGRTHEVVPFAFDWRRSISDSADALHEAILKKLPEAEASRQPIRIVAHSMGGLVTRAMLARYPKTWGRLQKLEGFHLMMLGTPNFGSYQAVRLVVGQYQVANMLALVDIHHGRDELLGLFSRFPGALELLPWKNNGSRDFAAAELWARLKNDVQQSWPVPDADALRKAKQTWELLNAAPIDGNTMVYVAGWASKTPCDYRVVEQDDLIQGPLPQIEFSATRRGDGTVTWDMGILPGVKTWYAEDTDHGSLLANPEHFPAYLELLQTGKTSRLLDSEPAKSRGLPQEPATFPLPPDLPGEFDQLDALGGFGPADAPRTVRQQRRLPGARVRIKCGDLAYATNPVCVGHYQGDTVVGAEARLDKALNLALSNRRHMGIYPGRLGTWEVFFNEDQASKPGGALVIGLGQVGELTPGGLENAITHALSDYALQVMQWHDDRFGDRQSVRSASVSFLLIGTGAGGFEVRSSVEAILRGVKRANEKLVDSKLDHRVLIDRIELIELYQDIAIQAARALNDALLDQELNAQFTWSPREIDNRDGQQRIVTSEAPNWWQRLEIGYDEKREELRFISLTNRARAEETMVGGNLRLARDFIRQSISTTQRSSEISRTLFEMLIPDRFKQYAPDQLDIVLLVDKESAAFPWELLEDRWTNGNQPPATVAGMVRQLRTREFRANPAHAPADKAFVVGNPVQQKFGDLPGARNEAEDVVRALSRGGFEVKHQIETRADDIMIGLHADAYRILHLAGHGVHEWEIEDPESCASCQQTIPGSQKTVSGMVIGDNSFLTPDDVHQMRWVPELVFINCCHLGNTKDSNDASEKFNYMAANLGVEFIRMGVKAVIAAGWAVDDAAAKMFATHFYQRMLNGEPFGRAVQEARKTIFDNFPDLNTWGAYQCYGDPDFHLRERPNNAASPTDSPFYMREELVVALENLARSERTGNGDPVAIEAILKRMPSDLKNEWMKQADVLAALASAWGELGELDKAVKYLNEAAKVDKSGMPLRLLEKRANFKARLAAKLALDALTGEDNSRIETLFEEAFAEIQLLLELGKTCERYNLLGSANKRRAMATIDEVKRREYLKAAKDEYAKAEALFAEEQQGVEAAPKEPFPYSTLNKWTAEILLAQQAPDNLDSIRTECNRIAQWAQDQSDIKLGFRHDTIRPESTLVLALAERNLKDKKGEIIDGLRRAREHGTSQRAFASLADQFDYMEIMLPYCYAKDQLNELRDIATSVRQYAGRSNETR